MANADSNPSCMKFNPDPFFSNYVEFDDSSMGCQDGFADLPTMNQEQLAAMNSTTAEANFSPSSRHQSASEKKGRYYRHTTRQIELLESSFKNCPNPDEDARKRLSKDLGLTPRQVKFWFQNRRTQKKVRQDRFDNEKLRAEMAEMKEKHSLLQLNYSKLQDKYSKLCTVLQNFRCTNCGGRPGQRSYEDPQQQLLRQNAGRIDEYGVQSGYGPNMEQQSSFMPFWPPMLITKMNLLQSKVLCCS